MSIWLRAGNINSSRPIRVLTFHDKCANEMWTIYYVRYSLFPVIISFSLTEDTVTNNEMNLILLLEAITIGKKRNALIF